MTSYRADKPNFLEFWVKMVKMVKMTLKVKVNDPYFQYQPRVSHDACLVQIWWFQLIYVTSYRVDKVKFTDRRTDTGNDNTPSAWKAKGLNIDGDSNVSLASCGRGKQPVVLCLKWFQFQLSEEISLNHQKFGKIRMISHHCQTTSWEIVDPYRVWLYSWLWDLSWHPFESGIIGSDNGLSPGRRQAIIWTSVGILLIGPLGTNFSEILIEMYAFSSKKCIWKCRLKNSGHFGLNAPLVYQSAM